jgi:Zn-dependent peptidase ImmA (M78 family)
LEQKNKAMIVWLILNGKPEKAIDLLAKHYGVHTPKIKVGLPKGRKKHILGCYKTKEKTIFVLNSDALREPFVILHEFYHHLRTTPDAKHRGTEKNANEFANEFIQAYKLMVTKIAENVSGSHLDH